MTYKNFKKLHVKLTKARLTKQSFGLISCDRRLISMASLIQCNSRTKMQEFDIFFVRTPRSGSVDPQSSSLG